VLMMSSVASEKCLNLFAGNLIAGAWPAPGFLTTMSCGGVARAAWRWRVSSEGVWSGFVLSSKLSSTM